MPDATALRQLIEALKTDTVVGLLALEGKARSSSSQPHSTKSNQLLHMRSVRRISLFTLRQKS